MTGRPDENEYAAYYNRYVSLVSGSDVLAELDAQLPEVHRVFASVPPEREEYRYAPGKWSIREVLGHIIDGERAFGYRVFAISRGEKAPLPSFDQDTFVAGGRYAARPLQELLVEFELVRRANLEVVRHVADEDWLRMGTVANNPVSARAVTFVMAGHVRHHLNVLRTSY